jgi:hypothetical protein
LTIRQSIKENENVIRFRGIRRVLQTREIFGFERIEEPMIVVTNVAKNEPRVRSGW